MRPFRWIKDLFDLERFWSHQAIVTLEENETLRLALLQIVALDITDKQFVSQGPALALRQLRQAVQIARVANGSPDATDKAE